MDVNFKVSRGKKEEKFPCGGVGEVAGNLNKMMQDQWRLRDWGRKVAGQVAGNFRVVDS
jgi:hypothetical protein